jgi:hypothetical protein
MTLQECIPLGIPTKGWWPHPVGSIVPELSSSAIIWYNVVSRQECPWRGCSIRHVQLLGNFVDTVTSAHRSLSGGTLRWRGKMAETCKRENPQHLTGLQNVYFVSFITVTADRSRKLSSSFYDSETESQIWWFPKTFALSIPHASLQV